MFSPGPYLDGLLLRCVFGLWTIIDGPTGRETMFTAERIIAEIPRFSTDRYAASLIVAEMQSKGLRYTMKKIDMEDGEEEFRACFHDGSDKPQVFGGGKSEAEAICVAALIITHGDPRFKE